MNCDPLARWYCWLEYAGFGRALERRRFEFLPRCGDARRVLMLGEGDGRFLSAFLRACPAAEVDYVDCSAGMLVQAEQRVAREVGPGRNVRYHQADAADWLEQDFPGPFDLICTHFFLDCFDQPPLESLVRAIERRSAATARWIVSDFRYAPSGWTALGSRGIVGALYVFFRVLTGLRVSRLPDHGKALQAVGFHRVERVLAAKGLLVSEWWERP